jgi:predicted Zn-dependent protease with MMP-like domain
LVAEALDDLPPYVQERLENVAVIVEDWPRPDRLQRLGYSANEDLLGLYEGINRLDRDSGYNLVTPDRITLFWRSIVDEVGSGDREAIRREVRKTVIHEVAHHFGFDDAELERLGG